MYWEMVDPTAKKVMFVNRQQWPGNSLAPMELRTETIRLPQQTGHLIPRAVDDRVH